MQLLYDCFVITGAACCRIWQQQWQSHTTYSRYTFSAKEKPACRNASSGRDDETQYSYFGARYYDSDLSVWLSVDPYSKKYPHLSPYCAFENNPIVIKDPGGDTTIYYSSDGKLLHFSNDKLPTSIVLIKSEYASTFSGHVAYAASLGIEHHDEANKGWRTRGLNIDVNSLRKFLKDNTVKGKNDICDNCPGGHNGSGYMNEYRANLYEKDNKLIIGNNVVTDNLTAYLETLPDIENLGRLVGTIHDHPNEGEPTFEYGPSREHDGVNMRELEIIVGREQIYIYGTRPQTLIKINIKTLLEGHVDY